MEHKNNGHEQEYPLYTERIVPSPKVKSTEDLSRL